MKKYAELDERAYFEEWAIDVYADLQTTLRALEVAREVLARANQCQFQRYYLRNDGSAYLAGDDDAEYDVKHALAVINELLGGK
jgi:hypothetical protein